MKRPLHTRHIRESARPKGGDGHRGRTTRTLCGDPITEHDIEYVAAMPMSTFELSRSGVCSKCAQKMGKL